MNHEIQRDQAIKETDRELPVENGGVSRVIYERTWKKEKAERHIDNLQHFTGFYKGTYFYKGIAQKGSDKNETISKV